MRYSLACSWMVLTGLVACSTGESSIPCRSPARPDEVCIAGGAFKMGHELLPWPPPEPPPCPGGPPCGPGNPPPTDFYPVHTVRLDPFYLDRFPATNAEYLACYQAGVCPNECWPNCAGPFYEEVHLGDPRLGDYPMATALHEGAEAYCFWRGKRLPTEAEWERAARGAGGSDYPWGNTYLAPDAPAVPPFGWTKTWLYPVGSQTFDESPEGARDLGTGYRQFLRDRYDYYYYYQSPPENPVSQSGVPWSLRPARSTSGDLAQLGYEHPYPAWVREGSSGGGMRCARDDVDPQVSEEYYLRRQRLLSGQANRGGRP